MLAIGMKAAVEEVLSSRAARLAGLQEIKEGVRTALGRYCQARGDERSRQEEARQFLGTALATGRVALRGEVGSLRHEAAMALARVCQARSSRAMALLAQLRGEAQQRRQEVQQGLSQQRERLTDDAARLRQELREHGEEVQRRVQELRGETEQALRNTRHVRGENGRAQSHNLRLAVGAIRSGVAGVRSAMKADLARARVEWVRTTPVPAAPAGPAPGLPVMEPTLGPPAPVADLPEKAFAYLADHPDGVRMREMEECLGTTRFKVMRALRTLEEEGKVRREGGLYYAR